VFTENKFSNIFVQMKVIITLITIICTSLEHFDKVYILLIFFYKLYKNRFLVIFYNPKSDYAYS